jgi:hypothetical protein
MRPLALAASFAAVLVLIGGQVSAAEPEPGEAETGQAIQPEPAKSRRARREPDAPAYPPPLSRWGVIAVGLGTTALAYGAGVGMSYAFPNAPGAEDLRTPIIGPWMAIANNGCAPGDTECSRVWIVMRSIGTAIGGLAQAGGILVAIEGILMPTQVASETPARRAPTLPAEPSPDQPKDQPKSNDKNLFWIPTPMALGAGGVGLGVVGRF